MESNIITVQIAPEKKGLFLKHSEYEITSSKHNSTVFRRYNDFLDLHRHLIARCPYRLIPRLPPKQLMMDSLLEERRRGLSRWLRIVSRHNVLGADPVFRAFLTDTTVEHQDHLRDIAATEPDEYQLLTDETGLPLEDQGRLAASREQIRLYLNTITRLKRLSDQQVLRIHHQGKDMEEMSLLMRTICPITHVNINSISTTSISPPLNISTLQSSPPASSLSSPLSSPSSPSASASAPLLHSLTPTSLSSTITTTATMPSSTLLPSVKSIFEPNTFSEMADGFKEVAALSEKCAQHQDAAITERFNLLIDVLTAHSDLCDRVEKGATDHQKAMTKMLTLNKQRLKGVIRGTAAESVVAIHEKEVAQTGVVGTLGRRSAFSLHCVLQETSVAQEYLRVLPSIMLSLTYEQNRGNTQISKIWENIIAKEADKLN